MNILQARKYYLLIKVDGTSPRIFFQEKLWKKQTKAIEDQRKKQIDRLKALNLVNQQITIKDTVPEGQLNKEVKNEIDEIKETEKNSKQKKFKF